MPDLMQLSCTLNLLVLLLFLLLLEEALLTQRSFEGLRARDLLSVLLLRLD
jgi:hypothetical protein